MSRDYNEAHDPAKFNVACGVRSRVQDGCTESNCRRCLTHPNHRGDMTHAGIGTTGKQQVAEVGDSASRLIDAIEGECDGLVISPETAAAILDHVRLGDPWHDAAPEGSQAAVELLIRVGYTWHDGAWRPPGKGPAGSFYAHQGFLEGEERGAHRREPETTLRMGDGSYSRANIPD